MRKRIPLQALIAAAAGVVAGALWPLGSGNSSAPPTQAAAGSAPASSEGAAAGQATVPRVVITKTALVRTPGAPGYDATRWIQSGEVHVWEAFELEPRDSDFANGREADLQDVLRDAVDALGLAGIVGEVEIECRTATCVARLSASNDKIEELYNNLGLFPLGDVVSPTRQADPDDPDRTVIALAIAFSSSHLDREAYRAWYEDLLTKKGLTRDLEMAGVPPHGWWAEEVP